MISNQLCFSSKVLQHLFQPQNRTFTTNLAELSLQLSRYSKRCPRSLLVSSEYLFNPAQQITISQYIWFWEVPHFSQVTLTSIPPIPCPSIMISISKHQRSLYSDGFRDWIHVLSCTGLWRPVVFCQIDCSVIWEKPTECSATIRTSASWCIVQVLLEPTTSPKFFHAHITLGSLNDPKSCRVLTVCLVFVGS